MSAPRIERIGDATLYLADCMDVLPSLAGVDAVVCDPPYGIGFKYENHDDNPDGYSAWLWSIIEEAERHCSEGAPIFVWQAMRNVRHFADWFPREWRIFAAAKNFVQVRPTAMQFAYDPVVVWWTPGKAWAAGAKGLDFHIANTAAVVANPANIEKGHPCPRPLDQVCHVVQQWCRPEGTVLDPFMGSGTTGVSCARLGRRFIGIEIEPRYFDIACRRIEAAYKQADLFIPAPRHVQEALL